MYDALSKRKRLKDGHSGIYSDSVIVLSRSSMRKPEVVLAGIYDKCMKW